MKTKRTPIYLLSLSLLAVVASCKEKKYNEATTYPGTTGDAECIESDTIGSELKMKIIPDNYTTSTTTVQAIVFNPQKQNISFGRDWELEYLENGAWYKAKQKKSIFRYDDEFMSITPPEYMIFRFPIHVYHVTSGKYRIKKAFNGTVLSAEFVIK